MEVDFVLCNQQILVIDCPIIVKNVANAIKMFGGVELISSVYQNPDEMLSVNLTPDSLVMRSAFLNRLQNRHTLIFKIKRNKLTLSVTRVACIGRVAAKFVCQSMVDFQYLPMTSKADSTYQSIHEHLTFKEVRDWTSLSRVDTELYMVPASFSRFRYPVNNFFQSGDDSNIVWLPRAEKRSNTTFVHFDSKSEIPIGKVNL
ncbi:hypothetical protein GJ496_000215 [Pomphorhynchus laevis]|nr:hypothetical protein GJ496_000215 [Pomphorhynchus laevis]